MKKHLLLAIFIVSILAGCDNSTGNDDRDNEIIIDPVQYQEWQLLSPDGSKLAYRWIDLLRPSAPLKGIRILDLTSGMQQELEIASKLPSNVKLVMATITSWCPYDDNRVLVTASTATDTVGDGKRFEYGYNAYIVSLDGKEFRKITPEKYGLVTKNNLSMGPWLYGSSTDRDLITFGLGYEGENYVWQEEKFYPRQYPYYGWQSKDGKYYFAQKPFEIPPVEPEPATKSDKFYLNGEIIQLEKATAAEYTSWSPDSKKIALTVDNSNFTPGQSTKEIWILDIEKFIQQKLAKVPVKIVKIPQGFFSFGPYAEFITNSTLAVAMTNTGTKDKLLLWEIDLNGNVKRQLTTQP